MTSMSFFIVLQTRKQKGFIKMKNTGFGYLHYTLSIWESEEDARNFARSGAHLAAMKQGQKVAKQIRIYTYRSDVVPKWKEVKSLLLDKGRVFRY